MLTSDQNRTPISRLAGAAIVIALLAVTIPIAGFGAAPQSGPLTFSGRLLDTIGHILPDQLIVLTHSVTKATHEGRSDASGYFTFSGLEAGDYDIDVRVPGFAPRYRVSLPPGQTLQRDITLQLGSLMETITVVKSSGPSAPRRPAGDLPPLYVHEPGPCDQSPKGGCIEQPTKIGDKKPGYPENRTEPEVTVILECRIGTDGVPKRISAVGPADPEFARAAADAVAQWRFTPTYLDGVALEVDMRVIVHFRAE